MSNLKHVRIENPGPTVFGTRIFIDGEEIHGVTEYTLSASVGDRLQRLTLTMLAGTVEINVADAEVVDSTTNGDPT